MYEVEIKVELTEEERKNCLNVFKQKGFSAEGITPQNDFYIEAKESPHGGYDLKRYRQEDDSFIYTEKIWEIVVGQPARRENEHTVSKKEFTDAIGKFPDALKITKQREWFAGTYQDQDISLTIDSVKFDHSPTTRYFLEAEIDVEDKNIVPKIKNLIREFLKELLGKPEITEAPGMFAMAFKKL